jgi:hypothetical protein
MSERHIIIGLIASTEFFKKIRNHFDTNLLESDTARTLSKWCLEYYDEYKEAPGRHIEALYYKKVEEGNIDKEIAEEIEEDILPDLSEELEEMDFNVDALYKETITYINARRLTVTGEQINALINEGKGSLDDRVEQASLLLERYKQKTHLKEEALDLSKEESIDKVRAAFGKAADPVLFFAKELGEFWNCQMVPGGLIGLLAPEKRGKTFLLLEFAERALRNHKNVAFFQAGDMNEADQIKRIGIYSLRRNTEEKYCKAHLEAVRDCIRNQRNECNKKERECDYGIFEDMKEDEILKFDYIKLRQEFENNPDYEPCCHCKEYKTHKLGVPWFKRVEEVQPITADEVVQVFRKKYIGKKNGFKLSTHANGTLSVTDMERIMDKWEVDDGFVPDVILVDYADLLAPSGHTEFRHQQNQIWKDLRRLSQTKRGGKLPLLIVPTQADAQAYDVHTLKLSNFSEDKRKYAHVTAMYGLNQDPKGREKGLGLLRINELIIRQGAFSIGNEVTVTQNLNQGRPVKQSYFNYKSKY